MIYYEVSMKLKKMEEDFQLICKLLESSEIKHEDKFKKINNNFQVIQEMLDEHGWTRSPEEGYIFCSCGWFYPKESGLKTKLYYIEGGAEGGVENYGRNSKDIFKFETPVSYVETIRYGNLAIQLELEVKLVTETGNHGTKDCHICHGGRYTSILASFCMQSRNTSSWHYDKAYP